ncbi:MAG: type III pantothenate kinase [Oscillospiraceae bacterium]|nr:type III pantothenate kinase [Oscillospiraceae bacterium]
MLLAVNIGNTGTELGLFGDEGELLFSAYLDSGRNSSIHGCALDIKGVFELYGHWGCRVEGAIISSVVPPATDSVKAAVELLFGVKALVLGPGVKTGLNIRAQSHSEMGEDLIAMAVGALSRYAPPLIIVDFGTAVTFSAVDASSAFLGGAICPGVGISLTALSGSAAQLPHISLGSVKKPISSNTADAMRSGVVYGTAGMVDAVADAMKEQLGGTVRVIATGQRIECVLEKCRTEMVFDKDLLMEGLYQIFCKNC